MWIVSENPEFAERALGSRIVEGLASSRIELAQLPAGLRRIVEELAPGRAIYGQIRSPDDGLPTDAHIFAVLAPARSQFEVAVELARDNQELPVFCIAGAGPHFRGHHGRVWSASLGNLHITSIFVPTGHKEGGESALVALPCVAIIDVLNQEPGLEGYGIKWVNDVLIDGAKVAGVLAHTSWKGKKASAIVFGMGMNVEVRPVIPVDPAVPSAICLRDRINHAQLERYTARVINALYERVDQWIASGEKTIISAYREASIVIGQNVEILKDPRPNSASESSLSTVVVRRGRVMELDDKLQIYLNDSDPSPVREGRLRFSKAW